MTDTVPLSVKWGKETITFDFVVAGGVKGLKTELEEKTNVPSDRMKLMAKSKGEKELAFNHSIGSRYASQQYQAHSIFPQAFGRVF
jgi:hypothetical protein